MQFTKNETRIYLFAQAFHNCENFLCSTPRVYSYCNFCLRCSVCSSHCTTLTASSLREGTFSVTLHLPVTNSHTTDWILPGSLQVVLIFFVGPLRNTLVIVFATMAKNIQLLINIFQILCFFVDGAFLNNVLQINSTRCTILFNIFIYFSSLHVSGIHLPIIRRKLLYLCDSGICHSVWVASGLLVGFKSNQQTRRHPHRVTNTSVA